jgi:hypothetical protein
MVESSVQPLSGAVRASVCLSRESAKRRNGGQQTPHSSRGRLEVLRPH